MTLNAIIANFQTFKLVDLLDIIIIAFLIYQLLGIVNRTRAGQLFKGALLVMAVYLVAETLNMRTVTWLLNSLLQVGLLTLVVLFQPEIRRALERMGQTDQWAAKLFNVKGRYNDPSLKGAWRSAIIAICDAFFAASISALRSISFTHRGRQSPRRIPNGPAFLPSVSVMVKRIMASASAMSAITPSLIG